MDNYDDFKSGIPRCDQIPFSSPLECKLLFQFCFNLSMTRTYEYHCVYKGINFCTIIHIVLNVFTTTLRI